MTSICPAITLSPRDYDAVLFDLDGVSTRTASVHAAAWKRLFDEFLEQRSAAMGDPFVPFDIDADYRRYVDGKSRYDGVVAFLKSRGIELPWEAPEDGSGLQTIHALGDHKDKYFLEYLKQHGVETYEASIILARTLREQQIKTAVVSSSNNCAVVLKAAGITQLLDVRLDGMDITRLKLKGKPAPDAVLEAARRIGIEPSRAVVMEDAIAGVEFWAHGRRCCRDRPGCRREPDGPGWRRSQPGTLCCAVQTSCRTSSSYSETPVSGHEPAGVRRSIAAARQPDRLVHRRGHRGVAGRTANHARRAAPFFAPGDHHGANDAHGLRSGMRQTEGLIGSVVALLGLALAVPDHSTLSRRSKTLDVPPHPAARSRSAAFAGGQHRPEARWGRRMAG